LSAGTNIVMSLSTVIIFFLFKFVN